MNTTKKERPDQTLFKVMMGAFFLLLTIAPAYWAFYNYGEYTRTKAFVEELKNKPEQFLTPDEKQKTGFFSAVYRLTAANSKFSNKIFYKR